MCKITAISDKQALWEINVYHALADIMECTSHDIEDILLVNEDAAEKLTYCYECGATPMEAAQDIFELL